MSGAPDPVRVTIDNVGYEVPAGLTVLRAAELQGIYIPTLCAHPELTPFGGCRMCIVEVEGMRGFPTACTTPVADGMIVRTGTAQLRAARMDVFQLLMSEHTASCLVCDEHDDCRRYSTTIRKAGVTTGCRYCSKDGRCEFQEVAEHLGVHTIDFPTHYRGMRVEDEDPFYDRDHNLCILCGRCVRVCQEVRVADVLGFKHRGRSAVVGPAFERSHLESGCEFCGACVTVCPTGALSEKANKWEGKPDREQVTTCPFCGVGCQLRLRIKGDRVIGSVPDPEPLVGAGQLCVRGRFCTTELINDPHRLRHPSRLVGRTRAELTWDEAIDATAARLADCPPDRFGMLVSPTLTNEDLYVAQKFARVAMAANRVDCSARLFYGSAFNAYLDLFAFSAPLEELRRAPVILCVGLDTRFGRSVVGVALRKATRGGRRVVTLHGAPHNLTQIAERWLRPAPGGEEAMLRRLVEATSPGAGPGRGAGPVEDGIGEVAALLREAERPVILLGADLLHGDSGAGVAEAVAAVARNVGARVLPLPAQNNLLGSLLAGAYPELLPGGGPYEDAARRAAVERLWGVPLPPAGEWNALQPPRPEGRGVLYLVGEVPPAGAVGADDALIYQNIRPMTAPCEPDLVLPSASFAEVDGTFVSGEGRLQRVHRAAGGGAVGSLPDWEILCRVARRMGKAGFEFIDAAEVRAEMSRLIDGFGDPDDRRPREALRFGPLRVPAAAVGESPADGGAPFVLTAAALEHVHRGFPLGAWVEGAALVFPEGTVAMHPEDARRAGIGEGDAVEVEAGGERHAWRATLRPEQPPGRVHATLRHGERLGRNPCRADVRKRHV
jgi:predicted molibdopterin-dependent oxidoreductase YjgC